MPAAYITYKLASGAAKLVAKAAGATQEGAEYAGTYIGAYFAYFAAFITADPVGGAAVALDIANKVSDGKCTPKGP